jgi:alpha-beta hydrolase superfamily lysophospholipase
MLRCLRCRSYVETFADFVDDAELYFHSLLNKYPGLPFFVFGYDNVNASS